MHKNFNLDNFISTVITKRTKSLLAEDFSKYNFFLNQRINGKSVLVIGGAGTIGSSYIKAILNYNITKLVVVDINENGLTELVRDLRSSIGYNIPQNFVTYPVDFGDRVFKKIFTHHGPFEIVANFAAHKHVRSEKDPYTLMRMIEVNILNTEKTILQAIKKGTSKYFCVSTDKAANPVNVMGASKKLMEEVIMAYSNDIQITTARFANVAFSNGSLLAGYIERLIKKQPISCPADVKRFFVSPEESGQICMLACMLGQSGDIFFPKLEDEKMVFFNEITENFFKEMGRETDKCNTDEEAKIKATSLKENDAYPVHYFITDTSGEKLYEEFYTKNDKLDLETYDCLGVVKNAKKESIATINETLSQLISLMNSGNYNKSDIIDLLKKCIPDFEHIETGKSLDQKM